MGTAVDTFDVAGRATIRSADGAFFHLAAPIDSGAPLATQVSHELLQRRLAYVRPFPGRERIEIAAAGDVATGLLRSLEDSGVAATVINADTKHAHGGLLLHVAGSPAERTQFDDLPGEGTAVLRCYREGELAFIDPLSLSAQDPTASQVLRRRLAASPAATELKTWLDTPAATAEIGLRSPALSLVTARLLMIIAAWQQDSPALPALRRTLWRLDSATLVATEHPVLPFPEPAKLVDSWPAPRR
ncbi:hypothetical protein DM793_13655 [Paenarthrobacter nitroguajacolicus]|uniref:hypothetical protein n=1 Tax=Paenarthrobacter nitroguajacolicus TaxID=211146 RepID=UPI0015B8944F|nr:hypothetical protein [Paenarthrobacter nitroguajacolicus]NWL12319.1 hypothetical protein [Paenarthrobacter nitroguajacolicus]